MHVNTPTHSYKVMFLKIMRISTYLDSGGAETSMRLYLKELSKRNKIYLLYFYGNDEFRKEMEEMGIMTYKLPFSIKGIVRSLVLYKFIKPDVVHTSLYKAEFLGLVLKIIYRCKLVTNRDVDIWDFSKYKVFNRAMDKIFHKYLYYLFVDKIIAITHHIKNYILYDFGFRTSKIEVVYYGLPINKYTKRKKKLNNKLVVGFVGRLVYQKGIDTFVKTLLNLKTKNKVEVVVCGDGYYRDFLKTIQQYLPKNIELKLEGYVKNITSYYEKMHLLFLPTKYEGFGLVFIESLLHNVIVLTSNIKPLDEVLNGHALFCEREDYKCFAEKIEKICKNYDKVYNNLFKDIEKHLDKFDISRNSEHLERIYLSLTNRKS